MKVLFDTNVILDVFLKRDTFSEASGAAISKAEKKHADGFVSASSITTIYYWAKKIKDRAAADAAIQMVVEIMRVTTVDSAIIHNAIKSDYADFEDEVIYQSAIAAGVDCIVTRDKKGFKHSRGPRILSPEEFVAMF